METASGVGEARRSNDSAAVRTRRDDRRRRAEYDVVLRCTEVEGAKVGDYVTLQGALVIPVELVEAPDTGCHQPR
jgi:hypothetical protein